MLTQPLVARLGTRNAQLAGLGALLVGLGLLATTAGDSTSITLVAAVAARAGHGSAYRGASAAVDAVAPADRRGALTAALYLAFYLGAGFPAVSVGLVTIGHPLATATSWVTAAAAGLVPLVGAAVVLVHRPVAVGGTRGNGSSGSGGALHRCRESPRGPDGAAHR